MNSLLVIKVGGNIIDDETRLQHFLEAFSQIRENKILVHGGGKLATRLAEKLEIPQQLIDGRRITDAETLRIITMVYAGFVNKNIVARLQALHCNAFGLTGADGGAVLAHRRQHPTIDYGFVGDIDKVNASLLQELLRTGLVPVIAPLTYDDSGQLLNTNADTMAQEIARSLSNTFEVTLVYVFEKRGVLSELNDESSVISRITRDSYARLKAQNRISEGMLPKLDNAFTAIDAGVSKVVIGHADELLSLIKESAGTTLANE